MTELTNKNFCVGCGACALSCPKKAISMKENDEGFLYPIIGDGCINCRRCITVCPINAATENDMQSLYPQKAYAAVTKSSKIWRRSASGGAFSEICRSFGDEETVVCGAAWNGFDVHHITVRGVENIAPLCKSKYISSNTESVFDEIKTALDSDKKVIFCGTPCQVAGLKKYLNAEYPNLLLIDFICHGVGSPKVFKECLKVTESDLSKSIVHYEFRSKKRVYDKDHIIKICTNDSQKPIYITNDRYMQLFIRQHCLRESCGKNCNYRTKKRESDITIGDFKGLTLVFPNTQGTKKNYSTIVFNTPKGKVLLNPLSKTMKLLECDLENIMKFNPLFYKHTYFSEERDTFFSEFSKKPIETVKKYTMPAVIYKRTLKGILFDILPTYIRKILNTTLGC